MKKRIFCALLFFAFGCIGAFGQAKAEEAQGQGLPRPKVLVVYYSRTGHTQLVAEHLARKFNADLEQLVDRRKRTGVVGASSAGKDAIAGKTTVLGPLKHKPADYDMILIGGPSWFGNVTPAVRTFISQNDLSGKKIGLFGMCHLTGVEHALQEAADLLPKGAQKEFPTMPLRERELAQETLAKRIDEFYIKMQE